MSNKVNTKEKFIETASRLFELKGYNATGLNEILAESGAPKGSLYYHFPKGKEQLALESINLAGEKIKANLQKNLESIRNPVEAIIFNMEHLAQVIDNEQKNPRYVYKSISVGNIFDKRGSKRGLRGSIYDFGEYVF